MKLLMTMINAQNFTPLAENEYTENIFRTDERGYFQTHIYFGNYIPAFSFEDAAGNYFLEFSADENGKHKKFQRHLDFYFDKNLGRNVAGWTYIFILKDGATIETHKLLILPDKEECAAMIRELLFIHRELFQKSNDNNSNLFENLRDRTWAEILANLNEKAKEILRLMKKIDARPRFGLQKIQQSCNLSKIRRFDDKIIRQYVISPAGKKFQVSTDKLSMNIFENRLLKNKLWRLKKFVETQTQLQKIKAENLKQDIVAQIEYIKNLTLQTEDNKFLAENTLRSLNEQLKDTEKNLAATPNEILKNLEKCLCLKVFREVEIKNEQWRMTQIFTNDANYRRAYQKLKTLDEIFDFSFDADEKSFPAEKMYQIYEWWVLAKIIEFLVVKLNWKSDGTPLEILRRLFNNLENLPNKKISLTHENSAMSMEIFYNTEINKSLNTTGCNLRPDFLFKVTANDITKIFILDAKYRNYERQGFNYWKEKDLYGVCFERYIAEIEKAAATKISASFIVHSDRSHDKRGKFLGKYVVYNGTVLFKKLFSGMNGVLQQVGSFYLLPEIENDSTPNQSEINLSLFFKMIFEYFMGQWEICWKCGSKVNKEPKKTHSGKIKYYLKCENCGEFWVKTHCSKCSNNLIIKHAVNYHIEQDGNWFVYCPKCGG